MQATALAAARSSSLFSGLTEQEKDKLLAAGHVYKLEKKEYLFRHGDPVKNFYLVCSGTIQIFRETPDGHEKTDEILIAGHSIGEREIVQNAKTRQFNAMAVEDTLLLEFSAVWLKESAKANPVFALNLLSAIARYAEETAIELEHQTTMSATQMVACFLQRLCVLYDFDPSGFTLPYSKTLIASRLGMELETFSRTLAKLKPHGISVEGTRVVFTNLPQIEAYVCGECSIAEDCSTHRVLQGKLLCIEKKSCGGQCK